MPGTRLALLNSNEDDHDGFRLLFKERRVVTKFKYAFYLFLMFSFSFFIAVSVGRADFLHENASNEPIKKEFKNPPMPDRSLEESIKKEEKEVKKGRPLKSEKITGPTAIC